MIKAFKVENSCSESSSHPERVFSVIRIFEEQVLGSANTSSLRGKLLSCKRDKCWKAERPLTKERLAKTEGNWGARDSGIETDYETTRVTDAENTESIRPAQLGLCD